jgi:hypothetical protein
VTSEVHSYHEFCVINLDDPLFICTKEEQRAGICFLWAEVVPGAEMHRRISVQYGNSVMSQWMVYEWIESFKNGHTSIKPLTPNGLYSGRAVSSLNSRMAII